MLRRSRQRRKNKAISYILSVIMMTLVTTSLSAVVLLWGLNEVSTSRNSFSSAIRARMERVQERIVVEDVFLDVIGSTLVVHVRNAGGIQIVVDRVYVNHQSATITLVNNQAGTKLSLGVSSYGNVTATSPVTLSSGTTYTVTVATTRGSTATGQWTA
ncbi:MAG: hypothetical protein HYU39_05305 [Thaumarchaeota archaeon]|nr:hypothetical protein [Nitrososphaerota archaeon]